MNIALILAGGKSSRFAETSRAGKSVARPSRDNRTAAGRDKLLAPVLGKPLVYYTIQALHDHPQISRIVIAASPTNKKAISALVKKYSFPRVIKIVSGGKDRLQSLQKAFAATRGTATTGKVAAITTGNDDIVLVHNAANPLVTAGEISAVLAAAKKYEAAAAANPVTDTIKVLGGGHHRKTHDRNNLVAAQTPQAAQYGILKKALQKAAKQHKTFTDESSLLENIGIKTRHIPASPDNFKITTRHDYERLKIIMGDVPENFLVGIGQDSHAFSATQKGLRLGGLKLENNRKLEAESDGDVILHAIFNAISQALGEGSLGRIATPMLKEKGITDSGKYLQTVLQKAARRGYALHNLGLMVEAKTPLIDPLVPRLKKSLSAALKLQERRIGITATTGELLTSFGRGEGIQCFAIVSLKKHEN